MKTNRKTKNIDAASMADVAFLLLTFFMMVTTINNDKDLLMKLPPNLPAKSAPINQRNVLTILLNDNNKLYVNNQETDLAGLHQFAIDFINNNGVNPQLSDNSKAAVIYLKNTRGSSYKNYMCVHNEIKIVYSELKNELALNFTNNQFSYSALDDAINDAQLIALKDNIDKQLPYRVLEDLALAKN